MARTYHRDANGRFASGGGGSGRPASKAAPTRAGNRLNRDNAGKITGIGKDGALARGGRLRTASGAKRATQTARMKGGPAGVVGRGGRTTTAAGTPKQYGRGVDAAKVRRMIGRLANDPSRPGKYNRLSVAKSANTRATRARAVDFMNKSAGLKLGGKGARATNPDNLTQDQMFSNIAAKIAKPTRRSTAKNRSKDVERRQQVRANAREAFRPGRYSTMHGQGTPKGKSGTLNRLPDRVAAAKGTPAFYSDSKGKIFGGRTSLRSKSDAARAQAARRAGVQKLRGTGGLGGGSSYLKRGKARQQTLTGGVATTYGKTKRSSSRR